MSKTIRISQVLWQGFGVVFALIIINNLVNQWSNASSIESFKIVELTYKIQQEIKDLEKDLVDAETGQRGFLYTNKENFLEPYNNAITKLDKDLLTLKTRY